MPLHQSGSDFSHCHRIIHNHHCSDGGLRLNGFQLPSLVLRFTPITDQRHNVEDDHNATVTEHSCTGDAADVTELSTQGFNHHFTGTDHSIHLQGDGGITASRQNYWQWCQLSRKTRLFGTLQHFAHIGQTIGLTCVFKHRRIWLIVGFKLIGADPHDTFNRVQWYRISLLFDNHHQRTIDRHGEGDTNNKLGTLALRRINRQRSTKLLNFAIDHIHAHAAPRYLG